MTIVDYIKKSDIEDIVKLVYKLDTIGVVDVIDFHSECREKNCEFLEEDYGGGYYCDCNDGECPYKVDMRHCNIARKQVLEFLNMDVNELDGAIRS